MVLKKKLEKEQTPVERLHDDIRRAIEKIEDDVDEIVRIHCHENDDAAQIVYLLTICVQTLHQILLVWMT